ncbi:Type 1 phosphatases regulator ypi1 [Umbelopsis nana]
MSEHPSTLTRHRELTEPATDGSRTVTLDPTQTESESEPEDDHIGILRLRGDPSARSPRQIQWAENVVDNEHLGRKKSKICCIYHRPRMPGDDSSSDSSSDSDSDGGDHNHDHDHDCNHNHHNGRGRSNKPKHKVNPRDVSPNAYERQPRYKNLPQPPPNAQ